MSDLTQEDYYLNTLQELEVIAWKSENTYFNEAGALKHLGELVMLKDRLLSKEVNPTKIIGLGHKNPYKLAKVYLDEQLSVIRKNIANNRGIGYDLLVRNHLYGVINSKKEYEKLLIKEEIAIENVFEILISNPEISKDEWTNIISYLQKAVQKVQNAPTIITTQTTSTKLLALCQKDGVVIPKPLPQSVEKLQQLSDRAERVKSVSRKSIEQYIYTNLPEDERNEAILWLKSNKYLGFPISELIEEGQNQTYFAKTIQRLNGIVSALIVRAVDGTNANLPIPVFVADALLLPDVADYTGDFTPEKVFTADDSQDHTEAIRQADALLCSKIVAAIKSHKLLKIELPNILSQLKIAQ